MPLQYKISNVNVLFLCAFYLIVSLFIVLMGHRFLFSIRCSPFSFQHFSRSLARIGKACLQMGDIYNATWKYDEALTTLETDYEAVMVDKVIIYQFKSY